MGRRSSIDNHQHQDDNHKQLPKQKSQTLPSSPTHSSSSSDFEFTIALSPRKSTTTLIPADQLFYKGQLLPLHLSPRLSMVRTLLLSSSSTSSSDTTTTASRDSTASSSSSDTHLLDSRDSSRRPSSVTDDDSNTNLNHNYHLYNHNNNNHNNKKYKYFSLSRFSSVFRKEHTTTNSKSNNHTQTDQTNLITGSSLKTKRVSSTAKDVIRKYLKKVKPLYEKLSQKQRATPTCTALSSTQIGCKTTKTTMAKDRMHSFSGNLGYPRRKNCASSCPSSMRSSPTHSGVLSRKHMFGSATVTNSASSSSSMEELQSAIQGAIAHCKNSMNVSNNNHSGASNSTTNNNNNNNNNSKGHDDLMVIN